MNRRHVAFIQHGDYAEAIGRMTRGEAETYAAQYYSIQTVAKMVETCDVTVISVKGPISDQMLANGVRAIGLGWKGPRKVIPLILKLEAIGATDIVLRTPIAGVLGWCIARRKRVLPFLADSFADEPRSTVISRLKRTALVKCLNSKFIEVVANHNLPASRDLARIGVMAEKIIPWDWPASRTPHAYPPKLGLVAPEVISLFYAGRISEDKGLSDFLNAIALLRQSGLDVRASVAGEGDRIAMEKVSQGLKLDSVVQFLGRIPNSEVFDLMRQHDFVVVPSRPSYPEGLPLTIYEGLCSRSPLLLSTHPMFCSAFPSKVGVRFFEHENPADLARVIGELVGDPAQYAALSQAGASAWDGIQISLHFKEIIELWMTSSPEAMAELRTHSIARVSAVAVNAV